MATDKQKKPRGVRKRIPTAFADNLSAVLKEKDLSARKASEIAGVNAAVFHQWLQGGAPQDLGAVLRLATALGVDFQWLLTGTVSGKKTSATLSEIFEIEDEPDFSGIFLLEAKRLKKRT